MCSGCYGVICKTRVRRFVLLLSDWGRRICARKGGGGRGGRGGGWGCFFFNDTATTEIYTLSLHDALPISTELNTSYLSRNEVKAWLAERVPWEGRPGTAEEVAKLVGALFVENIPYLTGETIYMDGAHGVNH